MTGSECSHDAEWIGERSILKARLAKMREAAEGVLAILEIGSDPGLHHMITLEGRVAWINRMIPRRERLRVVLAEGEEESDG
jgi:hypothetical protein